MQIDFHHTVTYVVARFAGFGASQAEIIAHAAQYVDDSTESGFVRFDNEMRYYRQASAHPVMDPSNIDDDADAESWLPFHFLPGNEGLAAGNVSSSPYINRLVCRPNSAVAQDMIDYALRDKDKPWGLHRLGIAAHVYADTWAHQGFVGLNDPINTVSDIQYEDGNPILVVPLPLPPVGHGQARSFPDQPYLKWSYLDNGMTRIHRDNPTDFLAAADALCTVFQRWLGVTASGLSSAQKITIARYFALFTDEDGEDRHEKWLEELRKGSFAFGAVTLSYDADQWKDDALGRGYERKLLALARARYPYSPSFQHCDWKLFHDAARCQRADVFTHILPQYGIMEN